MPFYAYNNYPAYNNAHYKASLIKVVNILKLNTVFRDYIRYKLKPYAIRDWIFIKYLLVIDLAI